MRRVLRAGRGGLDSTLWSDQYMRMALTFDTAAENHAWLMESLYIARGRLLGANAPGNRSRMSAVHLGSNHRG